MRWDQQHSDDLRIVLLALFLIIAALLWLEREPRKPDDTEN